MSMGGWRIRGIGSKIILMGRENCIMIVRRGMSRGLIIGIFRRLRTIGRRIRV